MHKPQQLLSPPLAGLGRRLCALSYELLLLLAVILVLGGIFQLFFPAVSKERGLAIMLFIYEMVLVFVYLGGCWVKKQTLAMKTWRIKLCQPDGASITWRQALIRYVIVFLMTFPLLPTALYAIHSFLPDYYVFLALIIALLPYSWALIDKEKQFLHDRMIGASLLLAPRTQDTKQPQ